MERNCPVCNKAGITDFTTHHVVCPQCNSDLKAYLLLHSISNSNPSTIKRLALVGVLILTLALSFLYFMTLNENKALTTTNSQLLQLRDTISNLKTDLALKSKNLIVIESKSSDVIFRYSVKQGDYPSKIAEFFYNDWRMYKKIETDNNLSQPYVLKVGQQLIIELKTE